MQKSSINPSYQGLSSIRSTTKCDHDLNNWSDLKLELLLNKVSNCLSWSLQNKKIKGLFIGKPVQPSIMFVGKARSLLEWSTF